MSSSRIEEIAERVRALKLTPDELVIFASFHVFISRFFSKEKPDYLNAVRKLLKDREPKAAIEKAAETILTPARKAKAEEWKRLEKLTWGSRIQAAAFKADVAELVKSGRESDPFITNKALERIVRESKISDGYSDESIRRAVLAAPTKKKKGGERSRKRSKRQRS